ncbi:MAG: hypothetical protein WB760_16970 [Xanthobacteraceae bacterium]
MMLRCDHCRGKLGLSAQRYWRIRFCSEACKRAYQRRLDESTRDKVGRLERIARDAPQAIGHPLGSRSRAEFGRRFAA